MSKTGLTSVEMLTAEAKITAKARDGGLGKQELKPEVGGWGNRS